MLKVGSIKKIQRLFRINGDFETRNTFRGEDNRHFNTCPEEIGQLDIRLLGKLKCEFLCYFTAIFSNFIIIRFT